MKGGNKKTCEKILLSSIKLLQKSCKKNHQNLLKLSISNTIPLLKMNKKTPRKGKRKTKPVEVPTILMKKYLRFSLAIRFILNSSKVSNLPISFNNKLSNEILLSSKNNSNSILNNIDQQKKVLMKKRYLLRLKYRAKNKKKYDYISKLKD